MLPFVAALLGAKTRATLVGSTKGQGTGGTPVTITRPTGTVAGDYIIIAAASFTSPTTITAGGTSGGSWTASNSDRLACIYKRLSDLGTITIDAGGAGVAFMYLVMTFRGAVSAAAKYSGNEAPGAGTTETQTGFTKSGAIVGIVSVTGSGNDADGTLTVTSPSGFTKIDQQKTGAVNGDVAAAYHSDPETYVNGANVVWDGFETSGAGGGQRIGLLLELT